MRPSRPRSDAPDRARSEKTEVTCSPSLAANCRHKATWSSMDRSFCNSLEKRAYTTALRLRPSDWSRTRQSLFLAALFPPLHDLRELPCAQERVQEEGAFPDLERVSARSNASSSSRPLSSRKC